MRAEIEALFVTKGASQYAGEPVSQLEHALQTAQLAELEGASNALITAALLHDIGHLFEDNPDALATSGVNAAHEHCGAKWLEQWYDQRVTAPIKLHVSAKRYLCAIEPGYQNGLSAASQRSLALQGGAFTAAESTQWLAQPYADDSLRLRRWDDAAKIPTKHTPPLDYFLRIATGVMK